MKSHEGCNYNQNTSQMKQLLGLLSYSGRFQPTKSLMYLAKCLSSEKSIRLPQAHQVKQPILVPFPFCRAAREGPSQQAQVDTFSPVEGSIPDSSEGPEVGSCLSVTSIPSGGHQNDVLAMTHTPAASENSSAVRNRIGGDNFPIRRKAFTTEVSNEAIKGFHCRGTHLALTSKNLHGSQAFKSRINKNIFLSSVRGSRRNS